MSEAQLEMGDVLPVEKGYVRWLGKRPSKKTGCMVSIYGKSYFFSQRGNGWLAKVNLNDPRITQVLSNPDGLVRRLDSQDFETQIQHMLCDMEIDKIETMIFNTNDKKWLLQAHAQFVELEHNQLAKVTEDRLAQLKIGPDGLPIGIQETKDEQKAKKGSGVPKKAKGTEAGSQGGEDVPGEGEPGPVALE